MRALLCCAVTLLALTMVCNAACNFKMPVMTDILNPHIVCEDEDGKIHEIGSEWKKNCMKCSCTDHGASCCDIVSTSARPPEGCEMIVDREKCTSKFVLKSDHTKEC